MTDSAKPDRNQILFTMAVAIGLGAIVRIMPALPGPFTSGDGGLILAMVSDIRDAGMSLPQYTSYNSMGVPFLYPPLALFVAAGLGELFGIDSLSAVRILPLVLALATLLAFGWLATRVLDPRAAAGGLLAFALMPSAYVTVVAGGGVTRGMGLLLVILAVGVAASRTTRLGLQVVALGLLLGFTTLTHPQAWSFAAAAAVVFFYRGDDLRTTVIGLSAAALIAVAVALPWMLVLADRHGWESLLAAGHRWDPGWDLRRFLGLGFAGLGIADLFIVFGVVGLVVAIGRRAFRLLLVVGCVALGFGGPSVAALPWSLLAGGGVVFVLDSMGPARSAWDRTVRVGMAGAALLIILFGTLDSVASEGSPLQRVGPEQASAMDWVEANAPPGIRLVVATTVPWGVDEISEWFPAVTGRQSVGTVQGTEWLGSDGFTAQVQRHFAIRECTRSTDVCLADWAEEEGLADAWVFIPKGQVNGPLSTVECCPALRESVREGFRYRVIYDGPGATIARPVGQGD